MSASASVRYVHIVSGVQVRRVHTKYHQSQDVPYYSRAIANLFRILLSIRCADRARTRGALQIVTIKFCPEIR